MLHFHLLIFFIPGYSVPCRLDRSGNGGCLDHYLQSCDNVILLGDFNSEPTETAMHEFCQLYILLNPQDPSCIDLILTNRHNSFQNSIAIETGLSDFHKMTITVLKTTYKMKTPKIIFYRD